MRVLKINSPRATQHLQGMLVGSYAEDEEEFLAGLSNSLIEAPESVLFLMAVEATSADAFEVKGFIIVKHVKTAREEWAHIHQAWVSNDEPKLGRILFNKLVFWAQDLGIDRLRGETARDEESIFRKYEFEVISQVMEYKIEVDYIDRLLESNPPSKEPENGHEDIDSKHAGAVPAASGGGSGSVSGATSGEGSVEHPVRAERKAEPGAAAGEGTGSGSGLSTSAASKQRGDSKSPVG